MVRFSIGTNQKTNHMFPTQGIELRQKCAWNQNSGQVAQVFTVSTSLFLKRDGSLLKTTSTTVVLGYHIRITCPLESCDSTQLIACN